MTAAAVSIWLPAHAFIAAGGGGLGAPLLILVGGYSLLNTGAIATVIALISRTSVIEVWRENFAWVWVAHAWGGLVAGAIAMYVPHVNLYSLVLILIVGAVGYATVRLYLGKVEESTGHLHKLNNLYLATVKALATAIDAKDEVTHGHIRRVQVYAVGLAKRARRDRRADAQGHRGGRAAARHRQDRGARAHPQQAGQAHAGRIREDEAARADRRGDPVGDRLPVSGRARSSAITTRTGTAPAIPIASRGDEIPLGARILSVVDCFDALTSDRPYRAGADHEAALDILRERRGTMYDPRVVEKFIEIHPKLTAALAEDTPPVTAPADVPVPGDAARSDPGNADIEVIPHLVEAGLKIEEAAHVLLTRLERQLPFQTAAVYAPRSADDLLEPLLVIGPHADLFRRSQIRLSEGLSGWVAAHGQFMVNANPALDLMGPAGDDRVPMSSALVVPVSTAGGGRGALAFYAGPADAFTLDDARVATIAAAALSRAFRLAPSSSSKTQAA